MKRIGLAMMGLLVILFTMGVSPAGAQRDLSGISTSLLNFLSRWKPLVDETIEALTPDASTGVEAAAANLRTVDGELDRLENLVAQLTTTNERIPLDEYLLTSIGCFTTTESVNNLEKINNLREEIKTIEDNLRGIHDDLSRLQSRLRMTSDVVCGIPSIELYKWCEAVVLHDIIDVQDRQDRLWNFLQNDLLTIKRELEREGQRRERELQACPEENVLDQFEKNLEAIVNDGLLDVGGFAESVARGGSREELADARARLPSLLERWVEQGGSEERYYSLIGEFGSTISELEQSLNATVNQPSNSYSNSQKCSLSLQQIQHCRENRDFSARHASMSSAHADNVRLMDLCIRENTRWHNQNC